MNFESVAWAAVWLSAGLIAMNAIAKDHQDIQAGVMALLMAAGVALMGVVML